MIIAITLVLNACSKVQDGQIVQAYFDNAKKDSQNIRKVEYDIYLSLPLSFPWLLNTKLFHVWIVNPRVWTGNSDISQCFGVGVDGAFVLPSLC